MSWYRPFAAIQAALTRIENELAAHRKMLEKIMSDETDLAQAVADLATALAANNAEIDALLTKITTPGVSPAAVQAAVSSIRGLIKTNADEVAKAQAAAP